MDRGAGSYLLDAAEDGKQLIVTDPRRMMKVHPKNIALEEDRVSLGALVVVNVPCLQAFDAGTEAAKTTRTTA